MTSVAAALFRREVRNDAADALTIELISLATALQERTRDLHRQAERSGFVQDMLRGRAGRAGYILYLRNLWPAYRALEQELERRRPGNGVGGLAQPALYRAQALASDLAGLAGPGWRGSVPLLPAGERYAHRILAAAQGNGARLIGHAYTRYLGDLSGGQILARLLANSLELGPSTLSFYAFPAIPDVETFKDGYRRELELAAADLADVEPILDEAAAAFQLNIDLSQAVKAAVAAS